MTTVDINRVDNTLAMLEKQNNNKKQLHNLNVLAELPSFTSWQLSRESGDEVITHKCVCMTAPCQAHSTVELETSIHAPHTHLHTYFQMRRPVHTQKTGPRAATERVHIASERGEGAPLYCCISLVVPELNANRDILAIEKWYKRAHKSSPVPLKEKWGYKQEDKMT